MKRPSYPVKNVWTPERRAAQAERLRLRQPWKKSTGPASAAGKAKASRNALQHGWYSAEIDEIRAYLRSVRRQNREWFGRGR
jgi:hypothetical protein